MLLYRTHKDEVGRLQVCSNNITPYLIDLQCYITSVHLARECPALLRCFDHSLSTTLNADWSAARECTAELPVPLAF